MKTTLPTYATVLGLSPAQVTAQAVDADYFSYALASQKIAQNSAQQWTAWKDLIRDGGHPSASGSPSAPVFPASPGPVDPGVEVRFRSLLRQIKASSAYNIAIGKALNIEGPDQTGPDLSTVQPQLDVQLIGNTVKVIWGWGGDSKFLDLCELQVDRGDGKDWNLLAYDTTPNYFDTAMQPAMPAKWKYRAIYRVADSQVGIWSQEVSIIVGG